MGVHRGRDEDEGEGKHAEEGIEPGGGQRRRCAGQLDEMSVRVERGVGCHHDRG